MVVVGRGTGKQPSSPRDRGQLFRAFLVRDARLLSGPNQVVNTGPIGHTVYIALSTAAGTKRDRSLLFFSSPPLLSSSRSHAQFQTVSLRVRISTGVLMGEALGALGRLRASDCAGEVG